MAKVLRKPKKLKFVCRQIPGTAEEKGIVDAFFQKNRHLKKECQNRAWILRGLAADDCGQAREFRAALDRRAAPASAAPLASPALLPIEQAQETEDSQEAQA